MKKEYIFIIILFAICILLITIVPGAGDDFIVTDKLYISEVAPRNSSLLKDDDNEYSDYIEIYNGYSYSIDLSKYYISDNLFDTKKYKLPNIMINPNEYFIIYCSGKDRYDDVNRVVHTNFKLNKDGEIIILSNKDGNIINKFNYPKLDNDFVYGFYDNKYGILSKASPGRYNDSFYVKENFDYRDIVINEYMSKNKLFYDNNGMFYDIIELYNKGNDVNIRNLYISDNGKNIDKFRLPDFVFKKNSYLIIYCSGNSGFVDNNIYANFKIGSDDDYLVLSSDGNIIDKVKIYDMEENTSIGIKDKNIVKFYYPTIGSLNNTGYEIVEER